MMATESSTQTRVVLWSIPRCMTTAFMRSIDTLDESVVFHENFAAAYWHGPEGNHKNLFSFAPYHTYDYVKALLQQEMPGKRVIFAKDFAFALQRKFEKIPDGYIHTFLIRNPTKVFMSLRYQFKVPWLKAIFFGREMQTYYPEHNFYFVDMWKLYVHIKDDLKKPTLVIDVDDFLQDPEAMMKIYCQSTGIPFRTSMLSWQPCSIWNVDWQCSTYLKYFAWWQGWYKSTFNSNGFETSKGQTNTPEITMLPPDVRKLVEISEPYYKLLYDERITI
ncbi:branched-chain-amino-acid aminotransferase-like protein 1 [Anneissia japonica]|uniref:branched-chain-amino-acid aminotransferase-like protein 1 n=1 Tax=Anneissia japonica TaxID=1529436 RepID=UPI0014255D69|nr:branched-chain-amino-acid aminotransferase-like protein 1 [Anneissia japonica]